MQRAVRSVQGAPAEALRRELELRIMASLEYSMYQVGLKHWLLKPSQGVRFCSELCIMAVTIMNTCDYVSNLCHSGQPLLFTPYLLNRINKMNTMCSIEPGTFSTFI